jgi:hypothetical protein
MQVTFLALFWMSYGAMPSACQSMVQVLDFRTAALQMTITNSSTYAYQPVYLDLLAKLGKKSQERDK